MVVIVFPPKLKTCIFLSHQISVLAENKSLLILKFYLRIKEPDFLKSSPPDDQSGQYLHIRQS
jgi:hypothetical protein